MSVDSARQAVASSSSRLQWLQQKYRIARPTCLPASYAVLLSPSPTPATQSEEPDYWPAMQKTADGLVEQDS